MIESARFTNVGGQYVDFNDQWIPFNEFTTEVDVRMSEREKALQHGLYPSATYLGKRLFHCNGDILELSSERYWERRLALVGACTPRPHLGYDQVGTLALLFTGWAEEVTCDCTIDGWPEIPLTGRAPSNSPYQVNFKAFDPRLYGIEQTVDVGYSILENSGGRTYDKTYDKDYLDSADYGVQLVNIGNQETHPVVVFNGPAVSPRLVLSRGDGATLSMALTGLTLAAPGNTATVDFLRRTVVSEAGANLYNYAKGSDWWAIEPSDFMTSYVTLLAASGATVGVTAATVTYRNAYSI